MTRGDHIQKHFDFQTLRERTIEQGKIIVLVGGLCKQQKLDSIEERFGFEVEWHEIDNDSPNDVDSIVRRIRAGRVGAVILLKGLMGHRTSKNVIAACHTCNVPLVTGGRAGTGDIEQALHELERKIAL